VGNAKHIGRVGALAVALGIGNVRRAATRMTASIGVAAAVVMATAGPVPESTASRAVRLAADSTALLVCGTTCPKFDAANVEILMNQFITPTHPGQTITPVAVTTPEEYWPITGLFRLVELAIGDPRLGGLGGPAWPDEPWWKLSGLFDLTIDQSIQAGVADLETAMTNYGNDHLIIYGYSQGAAVVIQEKRKLAEQYPAGSSAPDIEFVLGGDTNLPNGGLNARFPGLYIPILDLSFNGPEPTDTPFHTDVITRQYDGAADFPLYPLNVLADLNAVMGFLFLHTHPYDVSLADDATAPTVSTDPTGKNTYYFFETRDLPLFAPLRVLGVPESLIDVVEPFFRVIVDLGYDRSIPPWQPTPARLIPPLNPVTVTTDLVNAIGEGINNAATLIGAPAPLSTPAPVTLAAPATETARADISRQVTSTDTPTQTEQVTSTVPASETEQLSRGTATSTMDMAETAKPGEASTDATAASGPEPSASDDASEPTKPKARPATPRPVVRDSLRSDEQRPFRPQPGNAAAKAEPSSATSSSATSSPTESNSTGEDSSGGDADGC
jgi:hypothetical protein